jgi:hypothetical protein
MGYTCTGGDFSPANPTGNLTSIPSGTYASITVKGACAVAPDAVITVIGDVNLAPDAMLDAQSAPSTITVGHNVTAGPGSLLGLGCFPNPPGHTTGHPCVVEPDGSSNITVDGNITAWAANTVLLDGITVEGNVTLIGSEGTATATERATAIPWAIKTNTIGGNLIVADMTPIWVGVIRNHVDGNVILFNIHITDGPPEQRPISDHLCRQQHGRAEPRMLWTRPSRVRRFPRRGQRRRRPSARPVRKPDHRSAAISSKIPDPT